MWRDRESSSSSAVRLLYCCNACYALLKRTLPSALPSLKAQFSLDNSHFGAFSASFSLGYGVFKLVGGVLTDLLPADLVFTLGMLAGSIVNLCIPCMVHTDTHTENEPFSRNTHAQRIARELSVLWAINGALQGAGGPALSKLVIQAVPQTQRGAVWSNLLLASNVGFLLSPYVLLLPLTHFGWKGPFQFVGVLGMCLSLLSLCCPLPTLHTPTEHTADSKEQVGSSQIRADARSGSSSAIKTPYIPPPVHNSAVHLFVNFVTLLLANALAYFVAKTLSDWLVLYAMEELRFSYQSAINLSVGVEIGALAGTFFAGELSRKQYTKSFISLAFSLCALLGFVLQCLALSHHTPTHAHAHAQGERDALSVWEALSLVCVVCASVGINGPKAMLQLEATEEGLRLLQRLSLGHTHTHTHTPSDGEERGKENNNTKPNATEDNNDNTDNNEGPASRTLSQTRANTHTDTGSVSFAGTLSGVVGLVAQIGASGSGYIVSRTLSHYGWSSYVLCQVCGCVLLVLCLCVRRSSDYSPILFRISRSDEKKKAD